MPPLDPVVPIALRIALGLLFALAALHKARDLPAFRATLRDYRLVPDALAPALAPALVTAELALAALLLGSGEAAPAALGAVALLSAYTAAIAINLARGRHHIDCGCLGPRHRQRISAALVARNGLLVAASLLLLAPVAPRPLGWLDAVSAVGAAACSSLLWGALQGLAAVGPAPSPEGRR